MSKLNRRIIGVANRGVPREEFLTEISKLVLGFTDSDALEVWITDGDLNFRWEATRRPAEHYKFEIIRYGPNADGYPAAAGEDEPISAIYKVIAAGNVPEGHPFFTAGGSFWIGDTGKPVNLDAPESPVTSAGAPRRALRLPGEYVALAIMPFVVNERDTGIIILKSRRPYFYTKNDVENYEGLAQTIGLAAATRRVQSALGERIKELTCLYGISQLTQVPGTTLETILQGIADLLPQAFQYPELASASVFLDGDSYTTAGCQSGPYVLTAEITVAGASRGRVEVAYEEDEPGLAVSPFLKEEQSLLDAVAQQLALLVERRHTAEEKARLEAQLRHADRLATIGQLAAGVAHELNEPLANILGYAQLAHKDVDLPPQTTRDIERIIAASLHAREIVRKLLIFGRQLPTKQTLVDVNTIVRDGIYFLESRCAHEGLKLVRVLAPSLPKILADQTQIHQILVNLLVNAIQATPPGGTITLATRDGGEYVELSVADAGHGMSPEVIERLFVPFFTTKDVGQGTGLGLSVVHGIVTQHHGTISVWSEPGKGSRFDVRLPVADGPASREVD